MAVERDSKGRFLPGSSGSPATKWKKGVSGNPKGKRIVMPEKIYKLFADNTDTAIGKLFELMDDPDPNVRLAATKYFIDKGVGSKFQAFASEEETEDHDTMTINITRGKRKEH